MTDFWNCQLNHIQLSTQTCIHVSNRTAAEYTLCNLCVPISRTRCTQTPQISHFQGWWAHTAQTPCAHQQQALVAAQLGWSLPWTADAHQDPDWQLSPGVRVGDNQLPTVSLYSASFNLYLNQNKQEQPQQWGTATETRVPGHPSLFRLTQVQFQTTKKWFHLLAHLVIISATSLITPWQYKTHFYSF